MVQRSYNVNGHRHRVDIYLQSTTQDSRGHRTGDDTLKVQMVPAEIITLSGRQLEIARQTVSNATHRVKMRYPGLDLTTQHYLQFGTLKLHIGHVDDSEQINREFTLICGEDV
jgi:SPP1 family predicted phage head-tail adaptor